MIWKLCYIPKPSGFPLLIIDIPLTAVFKCFAKRNRLLLNKKEADSILHKYKLNNNLLAIQVSYTKFTTRPQKFCRM